MNLSIIVSSCDKYEDTWVPFFTQLARNWNSLNIPIYLITDTKKFSFDGLNISCPLADKTGGRRTWSENLDEILKHVETDYVLFMLDDFWVNTEIDESKVEKYLHYMEQDHNIGFICLHKETYGKEARSPYSDLRKRALWTRYRITTQAGIWDKRYLSKILRLHENAWIFENRGSWRSNFYRQSVYSVKESVINYPPGGTIAGGCYVKEYIEQYDNDIQQMCHTREIRDQKQNMPNVQAPKFQPKYWIDLFKSFSLWK